MVKELIEKYKRIQQLANMGFSIPRMEYFPADIQSNLDRLDDLLSRANQSFANIRTYKRQENTETFLSKHHIFVPLKDVKKTLVDAIWKGFECMVDIENPQNGWFSGSIMIENKIDDPFTIDYCCKPDGGAMVRMAEDTIQGRRQTIVSLPLELRPVVRECFNKFDLLYRSVVLEFSYLLEPAGALKRNTIFWEYRNLIV